ncbi:MAG TPA: hypothetical protein VE269_07130, partial [Gaiellaceae bacterium]|nr:hypothetical protein [Gaiellaceae bacterium]
RGDGPQDFVELVVEASAQLLALSDLALEREAARGRVEQALADGSALETYARWIRAQGGDPAEDALPSAPVLRAVDATEAAHVHGVGAVQVGLAALHLGAGRRAKEDAIDYAVGVVCRKKRGDSVAPGETLAEVHAPDEATAERAAEEVRAAYVLGDSESPRQGVVLGVLTQ